MHAFIEVLTTTGDRATADRLATELVDRGLAACVQCEGPITSTYRWQGRVEHAQEWRVVAKSQPKLLPAIEKLLTELHNYELPELVVRPIVGGSSGYLNWLTEQLHTAKEA